jgi:hypothetical protein
MLKKVLGANLLVFVAYVMIITLNSASADKGFNIAIGMGFCIVLHVGVALAAGIACLIFGKRDAGKSFLINGAVLAPIGFVTWLILLSIFG